VFSSEIDRHLLPSKQQALAKHAANKLESDVVLRRHAVSQIPERLLSQHHQDVRFVQSDPLPLCSQIRLPPINHDPFDPFLQPSRDLPMNLENILRNEYFVSGAEYLYDSPRPLWLRRVPFARGLKVQCLGDQKEGDTS
jgi:hypothetical protein